MDAPYITVKGPATTWTFVLAYAPMEDFMPLAQEQLAASRLPYPERDDALQVGQLAEDKHSRRLSKAHRIRTTTLKIMHCGARTCRKTY
jgi:hypothetical protein